MELTRQTPEGSLQLIESYGEGSFKIAGMRYRGSVLVFPDVTRDWQVSSVAELGLPSLKPVIEARPAVELLIVGCGPTLARLPVTLGEVLMTKGIGVETMDTGAACRTYNVLAGEQRRVAAALIAL